MMEAFRMITSESGSAAVEDGVGVVPSAGWGAVLSAARLESRVGPAFFKEAQADAGRLAQQRHVKLALYVESGVARAAMQVQSCWDGAQRLELVTADGMVVWGQIFE